MAPVLQLFRKKIRRVNNTRNVCNVNRLVLMTFPHVVLLKVHVLGAFVCHGFGPRDGRFVVVVNFGTDGGVGHVKVSHAVADGECVRNTLVCCVNFSFAGAE